MNTTIIMGRLVEDVTAETKQGNNGTYTSTSFRCAVDRPYTLSDGTRPVDFLNFRATGKTAEFISKYFHKGDKILVSGSTRCDQYEKDGKTAYFNYINVDSAEFGGSKRENTQAAPTQAAPAPQPAQAAPMQQPMQTAPVMPMQAAPMQQPMQAAPVMPAPVQTAPGIQMPPFPQQAMPMQAAPVMPAQAPQFIDPGDMDNLPFN